MASSEVYMNTSSSSRCHAKKTTRTRATTRCSISPAQIKASPLPQPLGACSLVFFEFFWKNHEFKQKCCKKKWHNTTECIC
jgi:hypothetical protein